PRSYTSWRRAGSTPLRMIVGPVEIGGDSPPRVQPGTVVEGDGNRVVVATGAGCVALRSLQPAGKRELDIREFQLGYRLEPGDRFGPEA
ncbi:MAG: methionyl-tRNA formyltransferase, partial [Pirellulales bacterium]|nr:methionyl-tRNA formyltransferase [Pirellulales bacterium]